MGIIRRISGNTGIADAPVVAFFLLMTIDATLAFSKATPPAQALTNAHSHNDYEQDRAFFDALREGFTSFEVDIHLRDGHLLVGHDSEDLDSERTIQSLYLNPIQNILRERNGWLYTPGASITLLVDIKTEAEPTYIALSKVLQRYKPMLTALEDGAIHKGAVEVIISGNRPRELMERETTRLAFFDGRIEDLSSEPPPNLMTLISGNWASHFQWRGEGPLSETETAQLNDLVAKAHDRGLRIRFWNIPDTEAGWRVVSEAGVDLINTDRIAELSEFLLSRRL